MPRKLLRFVIGCAAGFLLWRYGTPVYASIIAPLARLVTPLAVQFAPAGMEVTVKGSAIPAVTIPFGELTYNVILFLGLFATTRGLFRDRGVARFAVAVLVLAAAHVLATAADAMAAYSTRLGAWSNAHFSPNAQDFWEAVDYAYRIGGMFGIAFACWYVAAEPAAQKRKRKPRE